MCIIFCNFAAEYPKNTNYVLLHMKSIVFLLAMSCCCVLAIGQICEKGDGFYNLGQYDSAIDAYETCLEQSASDVELLSKIDNAEKCMSMLTEANYAEQYKDYIKALDLYTQLYALHPLDKYESKCAELQKLADMQQMEIDKETREIYANGLRCYQCNQLDSAEYYLYHASNKGNVEALYYLGEVCYKQNGWDSYYSYEVYGYLSALDLFKKAAEKGYLAAMYKLGAYYEAQNKLDEGVKYYIQAAKGNDENAIKRIMELYSRNLIAASKDVRDLYALIAANGRAQAQYQIGVWAYESNQNHEAKKWLEKARDNGWAEASNLLTQVSNLIQIEQSIAKGDSCMRGKLYAEAIVHYACAVQYGSQACYYQLGVCCLYLDDARAINYLVQAANAGHVEAMYELGECYQYGKLIAASESNAIKYYQLAAAKGHTDAKVEANKLNQIKQKRENIARYNKEGDAATAAEQYDKAIAAYDKAIAEGDTYAVNAKKKAAQLKVEKQKRDRIAAYNKEGDAATAAELYDKAIAAYDQAIAEGDTYAVEAKKRAAQLKVEKQKRDRIAAYNKEGDAAIADEQYDQAIAAYDKAIAEGDTSAVAAKKWAEKLKVKKIIQTHHQQGDKEFKASDYRKAIASYQQAVDLGDVNAIKKIGKCYELMGEAYYLKAVEYYTQASQKGDVEAHLLVGKCYAMGLGFAKDDSQALQYYLKAANAGNSEAQRLVANCYEKGIGTKVNLSEAIEWYMVVASSGDLSAKYHIAELYEKDDKDEHAFAVYFDLAKQGYADAQYMMGRYIDKGWETGMSMYNSSRYWYGLASEKGHQKAKSKLLQIDNKIKRQNAYANSRLLQMNNKVKRQNSYASYKTYTSEIKSGFKSDWGNLEMSLGGISLTAGTGIQLGLSTLRMRFGCFLLNPLEFVFGLSFCDLYPYYDDYNGEIISYQPTIGYYFPVDEDQGAYVLAGPTFNLDMDPYFKVEAGYRFHFGVFDMSRADLFIRYDGEFTVGAAYHVAIGW